MKKIQKISALFLAIVLMFTALPLNVEAAAVRLNKTKTTIYVGSSEKLKIKGTSKKVEWSSSDKKTATVSQTGKVSAKRAGTAVIRAKVNKRTYTCRVTVKKPYLSKTKVSLKEGKTYQLKLTGTKAVSWKSSNRAKVSVSSKGKITAKKAGTVTITCQGKDKKTYRCKVTVTKAKKENARDQEEEQVYAKIIKMKKSYPEGMKWTNDNFYEWKGGIYRGGYGCSGFAFLLSDAAFGSLPASKHTDFGKIRVGDILRINYDTHSVIVLSVKSDRVVVAEGNYNRSIHWGREIMLSDIRRTGTYVMTRYPK